jgi:hypothetical protein
MEDLEDVILNCQGDNEFGELLMFKDQVGFGHNSYLMLFKT